MSINVHDGKAVSIFCEYDLQPETNILSLVNSSTVNPFHVNSLFLYALKTEYQRFFDVFRGYKSDQWHEMG